MADPVVAENTRRKPKILQALLRVGIGAAVIAFIVLEGDVREIGRQFRTARPSLIAGAVVLTLAGILLVQALRWRSFLRPLGIGLPPRTLVRMTSVGMFFNAFLPTGVGGDAYKAIRFGSGRRSQAFSSVLADRAAGFGAFGLFGLAGAIWLVASGDHTRLVLIALVLGAGVLAGGALVVAAGERLVFGPLRRFRAARRLGLVLGGVSEAMRDPRALRDGAFWAVIFQAVYVGVHVLAARALGIMAPVAVVSAIVLLANLAGAVPITVNGLGLREGTFVVVLRHYGVLDAQAKAFALLILGLLLATSAIGGLVYMIAGGEIAPEEIGAE